MTLRERLSQLNRLQHGLWFKLVASGVILALAIAAGVTYTVWRHAQPAPNIDISSFISKPPEPAKDAKLTPEEAREAQFAKERYDALATTAKTYNAILAREADPTVVWARLAIGAGLALGAVWIGLGLTVLFISTLVAALTWPLYALGDSQSWLWAAEHRRTLQDSARFIGGVGALTLSFFILMQALKLALGRSSPVTAIARNVVGEAVRMRVSIIFIVMLLFGLASLPGLLDDATPLRYRVQSFLQYGTGGTFWVIAILVLFLAVGSVAFEQRDRIIWQTMTKPVAPWQYILGKWLGVVGVAAVLLSVTAAGVFLFTGYLRNQVAVGEVTPYMARNQPVTEDRLVLETQVLTARASVTPDIPTLTHDDEEREIDKMVARAKQGDQFLQETQEVRDKIRATLRDELRAQYMSIGPGQQKTYYFTGLKAVKENDRPMTLRYKVSIGADDPRQTARVSFYVPNAGWRVQEVPLGQALTFAVLPTSIEIVKPEPDKDGKLPPGAAEEGVLALTIANGDRDRYLENPESDAWKNPESMSIPPDGLEISFPAGGYESNFFRVMIVLWLKLAFLAMVGVWAATYLSFSVASLIAFGTFLIAESASFLNTSLEYFNADDAKGNIEYWKVLVRAISVPIAKVFKGYAELRPTANLVDGRMLDWATVATAALVLGALSAVLYAVAVHIFRKRELATYSGQ